MIRQLKSARSPCCRWVCSLFVRQLKKEDSYAFTGIMPGLLVLRLQNSRKAQNHRHKDVESILGFYLRLFKCEIYALISKYALNYYFNFNNLEFAIFNYKIFKKIKIIPFIYCFYIFLINFLNNIIFIFLSYAYDTTRMTASIAWTLRMHFYFDMYAIFWINGAAPDFAGFKKLKK